MAIPEIGDAPPSLSGSITRHMLSYQIVVITLCVLIAFFFFQRIPSYYDSLLQNCIGKACSPYYPPTTVNQLAADGLTPESYALLFVAIDCTLVAIYYLAATILLFKCRREPLGLLAALMLISFGTVFPMLTWVASIGHPMLNLINQLVSALGWTTFFLFFFLFPYGSFERGWITKITFLTCSLFVISNLLPAEINGNVWVVSIKEVVLLIALSLLTYTQISRYRKMSTPEQRQQTKWVVYGVAIVIFCWTGLSVLFDPAFAWRPLWYAILNVLLYSIMSIIPLTLSFAILRHRLWQIDPIVKRTIVYTVLSVCIIAIYTLSVQYLSRLFQTQDNIFISLIVTGLIAVLFSPMKERLQRVVNRLMKGRHDDPYAVLADLGDQLVKPIEPRAMLDVVVYTIKDALRLPFTAIEIDVNGQDTLASSAGEPTDDVMSFPIIHRGNAVGTIYASPRSSGEQFTKEDGKLLSVLLQQAGPIVQNVNMTLGLRLLTEDLQNSREKMIHAREEERREIRRNLHNELTPRLADIAKSVDLAESYLREAPDTAVEILSDFRSMIRAMVDEIRTLVHDLRPPSLDELGLIGAIQERIHELCNTPNRFDNRESSHTPKINLVTPQQLPPLPAAVEVAAFRIVTEALSSVVHHAPALHCVVRLEISSTQRLLITVTDNGSGAQSKHSPKETIGLFSIRERAAELGGTCTIDHLQPSGTRVIAELPF
ncbi:GAF domain-containing sensor histidine kinase [Brevibacillus migulae]|uniref:GAF domain-containing sensor histidine kinase n=1 Tax=Brevibacillus migulae TaxID=1644114 RepID=UPI00106F06EB|nr:histidine kinase [Brevibacillus migulae]